MKPLIVTMDELEPDRLNAACNDVIVALMKYDPAYKVGALHSLLASFPVHYEIIERPRTEVLPDENSFEVLDE